MQLSAQLDHKTFQTLSYYHAINNFECGSKFLNSKMTVLAQRTQNRGPGRWADDGEGQHAETKTFTNKILWGNNQACDRQRIHKMQEYRKHRAQHGPDSRSF